MALTTLDEQGPVAVERTADVVPVEVVPLGGGSPGSYLFTFGLGILFVILVQVAYVGSAKIWGVVPPQIPEDGAVLEEPVPPPAPVPVPVQGTKAKVGKEEGPIIAEGRRSGHGAKRHGRDVTGRKVTGSGSTQRFAEGFAEFRREVRVGSDQVHGERLGPLPLPFPTLTSLRNSAKPSANLWCARPSLADLVECEVSTM